RKPPQASQLRKGPVGEILLSSTLAHLPSVVDRPHPSVAQGDHGPPPSRAVAALAPEPRWSPRGFHHVLFLLGLLVVHWPAPAALPPLPPGLDADEQAGTDLFPCRSLRGFHARSW